LKVLLTGGNGFLGSHVAEELAREGHELRLLLRSTSRLAYLEDLRYERAEGDMRDEPGLRLAAKGVDAVVHVAGLNSALKEADYFLVNAHGTAFLANAAAEAGVERFVYLSSLAAQGPSPDGDGAMPEIARPVSAYGRSKLAGEEFLLDHVERMRVAIIRSPVVYGPRDRSLLPFYKLMRFGLMPLYGDGSNRFSWVHVSDLAAGLAAPLAQGVPSGRVYTIADGPSHSWRELASMLAVAMGRRVRLLDVPPPLFSVAGVAAGLASVVSRRPLLLSPEKVVEMRQRYWVCDNQRIGAELGWKPRIGAEEGIRSTLRWYRDQRWL
jgi:nucleoside-diphosphate-sugar epimerase